MSDKELYYAAYCILDTQNADSIITVNGNTVVVGAELHMTPQTHVTERGKEVDRIVLSRGEMAMGFLPPDTSKQVKKRLDEGWTCRFLTVAAIFDKRSDSFATEAVAFCYDPAYESTFEPFIASMEKRIAKGERPVVALSPKELARVIESSGTWNETKSQKMPKLERGTAYYKTKRTNTEKLALQAASGNKGCYVGLFVVVFAIIFSIIWFIFLR